MTPPRIRGRAGHDETGRWFYEISFWNLEGTKEIMDGFTFGPFETEKEAREHGKKGVEIVVREFQAFVGADADGEYLDFRNVELRKFGDEQ